MLSTSSYALSFATVKFLRPNLIEIVVNDGVEITVAMLDEWVDFMLRRGEGPYYVLVNKVNGYSYSFDAQMHLSSIDCVKAAAVVTYTVTGPFITQSIVEMLQDDPKWEIETFAERDAALNWLLLRCE